MNIQTYDTQAFLRRFMAPSAERDAQLQADPGQFFVVRLEAMYRQVTRAVPPSRSIAHSFLLLTAGAATMTIGYDIYTATAGSLLFVPAGQVFSFGSDDVNEGYLFHVHPHFLADRPVASAGTADFEFLTPWGNLLVCPPADSLEALLFLSRRMLVRYQARGLQGRLLIQSYLMAFLSEVAQVYQPVTATIQPAAHRLTHAFKALLAERVCRQHHVADYAAQLHITPNHLNKVLRETTGKAPTRWIDEALLLEAKVRLSQTPDTIAMIADQLGFADPSYFSRLFRRYEGLTPSAFRRRIEPSGT